MPVPAGDAEARWRARARAFADAELRPRGAEIDRTDRLPTPVVAGLAREGFLGLGVPAAWGGQDGDARTLAAVLEEIAAGNAATAVELSVHLSVCAHPILDAGTDAQKREHLPALARGERLGAFALSEPGSGSDAAALRTRYVPTETGYELTGTKMFISNGASAGLVLLFARREPSLGAAGISAFLVPAGTPGLSTSQRLDKLGLRGSETMELVLAGVRVGPAARLGPEGDGLRIALRALAGGRVGIAACALGVAREAFETMREAVRQADTEANRQALARAYGELVAARLAVAEAATRKDAGEAFVLAASVAKLLASRAAVSIASAGLTVASAAGAVSGSRAERLFRDARVFPIVEGTSEIQERVIAQALLDPEHGTGAAAPSERQSR